MSLCGVATRFRSLVACGLSPGASASFSRLSRPRRAAPAAHRRTEAAAQSLLFLRRFCRLQENSPWFSATATVNARQDEPVSRGGWGRIRRAGQRVQFGGYAGGVGRADPLQDRQRLPQPVFGVGGAAGGLGAPAQAGQRVRLLQRDAELAGQVQGLLVARPSLVEVTAPTAFRMTARAK